MDSPYTDTVYGWWKLAYFQIVRWKDGSSVLYNFGFLDNLIRISFGRPNIPLKWAVGR